MYHIKNDQRSILSSEMLYEGLAKLTREKPFTSITVTNLVETAGVGRTTFYRNFDAIEDIYRLRCNQVFDGLMIYLIEHVQQNSGDAQTLLIKPMLRYFDLHSEVIELLMIAKRIDIIQDSFRQVLIPFKQQFTLIHSLDENYIEYGIAVRIGITTNILMHWIETGKTTPPDELADNLTLMVQNMVTLHRLL